ncbi:MAG: hypothetical protein RIQ93_3002 [Verrucomicrobiota bacterium]|jgi:histidyl-tRNA synthetase
MENPSPPRSGQKLSTQPYKGTRDFLPDEMSVRTQLFDRMFRTVELFGFRRYDGPVLESAAIYEAKSGEEIANQQLYRLTDKGDRQIALRPEMTPSVARMIAGNANDIPFPARWYSHVNCHRYERPQRGRVREHWQLNVDIFGSESVDAEVEIFDLVGMLLGTLGATPDKYLIRVNDRILVEAALKNFAGIPPEKIVDVGMVIDRWEKSEPAERGEALVKLGLDDQQRQRVEQLTTLDLAAYCEAAGPEAAGRSRVARIIREGLSAAQLKFDPLIMRAFNYYTSTVFEVFDVSPQNRRSIFGGGRYDDLASLFTNRRIPGIGFGMGDVTTWNFLQDHGLLPKANLGPDIFVFGTNESYRTVLREVTRGLRAQDLRVEPALDSPGIGHGLKHANKLGAKFVVLAAENEIAQGCLLVKDMKTSEQHLLPFGEVVGFFEKRKPL